MKRAGIDRWDIMVFAGVLLIAVGLWYIWPPLTAFWLGVLLIGAGLMGARR